MGKPRIRAASHSCLQFRAAVPVQQHRVPPFSRRATAPTGTRTFPLLYKKTARSISTGSGRFLLFFCTATNGSRSPAPSSPHFYPQHSGSSADGGTPCRAASHQSKVLGKEGAQGGKSFFKRGFLPRFHLHRLPTRHLSSPYAAQTNDILLISFGPLDGGGHDAEALQAEALLTKQQHFVHRLLA